MANNRSQDRIDHASFAVGITFTHYGPFPQPTRRLEKLAYSINGSQPPMNPSQRQGFGIV